MNDKTDFRYINISHLKLDVSNPRLPASYRKEQKTESEIIDFLLLEASTLDLMLAIGENGFFQGEQLLVVEDESEKGTYIAIEGNRRLAACKLLNDYTIASAQKSKVKIIHEQANHQPTEIPCLVFADKNDILRYLGYRHITGIQPWKTLEKARYLSTLKHTIFPDTNLDEACRELAKMIGSKRDYVKRLLAGYEVYTEIEDNAFYKIPNLNDTNFHFFYIADSLGHKHIKDFLEVDLDSDQPIKSINKSNLEKLTNWFFKENEQGITRVKGKSDDLNKLNRILESPIALKSFEEGATLYEADELTGELDTLFENSIRKAIDNLEQADKLIHKVHNFYAGTDNDLKIIKNLVAKLQTTKANIENDQD